MTTSHPRPKKHNILIQLVDSNKVKLWVWEWEVSDENHITQRSQILGSRVTEGKTSSVVRVYSDEEAQALATIIQSIPAQSIRPPFELSINDPSLAFSQLLHLATALWNFQCVIPHNLEAFAERVLRQYEPLRRRRKSSLTIPPKQPPVLWMFIALVFGWEDIFKRRSVEVITTTDYDRLIADLRYTPGSFSSHVIETRNDVVLKTYIFIRSAMRSLDQKPNLHEAGVSKIKLYLENIDNDIGDDSSAVLNSMTAWDLLVGFEDSLRSGHEPPKATSQRGKVNEKVTTKHGKGGSFGAWFRHWIKEQRENARKTNDHDSVKSDGSSENPEWKTQVTLLENKVRDWRITNLEHCYTSPAFEPNFARLRDTPVRYESVAPDTGNLSSKAAGKLPERSPSDATSSSSLNHMFQGLDDRGYSGVAILPINHHLSNVHSHHSSSAAGSSQSFVPGHVGQSSWRTNGH